MQASCHQIAQQLEEHASELGELGAKAFVANDFATVDWARHCLHPIDLMLQTVRELAGRISTYTAVRAEPPGCEAIGNADAVGEVSHDSVREGMAGDDNRIRTLPLDPLSERLVLSAAVPKRQRVRTRPEPFTSPPPEHQISDGGYVRIDGLELEVNHGRQAVLPGCGLYDERFQRLAEYAETYGELPNFWIRDADGHLLSDPSRCSHKSSFTRSAYRHLERALYRLARAQGLL